MGLFEIIGQVLNSPAANSVRNKKEIDNMKIGDYPLKMWEAKERRIGILGNLQGNLTEYNHSIGIYKAYYIGKLVYIGRVIEYNNGGFRKRLTDYIRKSPSGRGTGSSSKMNLYKDEIQIGIIDVVSNEEDVEIVKKLERALIRKYRPEWNVQFK